MTHRFNRKKILIRGRKYPQRGKNGTRIDCDRTQTVGLDPRRSIPAEEIVVQHLRVDALTRGVFPQTASHLRRWQHVRAVAPCTLCIKNQPLTPLTWEQGMQT